MTRFAGRLLRVITEVDYDDGGFSPSSWNGSPPSGAAAVRQSPIVSPSESPALYPVVGFRMTSLAWPGKGTLVKENVERVG